MFLAIPAPAMTTLAVADSTDQFPVHRIYCVGRNYAAHAREMGADPNKEQPFFFMKPADAALQASEDETVELPYPPNTEDYHYEVELVAALSTGGRDIPVSKALDHVFGYAIGLDMTRRDRQADAKKKSHPWELGKAADHSAPIGPVYLASDIGHPVKGAITLAVDGVEKQRGDLSDMIWSVAEQISYLSQYFELKPGDVIFTGTPEGVGPVVRGQTLYAEIESLGGIRMTVT